MLIAVSVFVGTLAAQLLAYGAYRLWCDAWNEVHARQAAAFIAADRHALAARAAQRHFIHAVERR